MPAKKIDPKALVVTFKRRSPRAHKELAEWVEILATYAAEAKRKPKTSRKLFTDIDEFPDLDQHAELHFALGYITAAADGIGVKPWDAYDAILRG